MDNSLGDIYLSLANNIEAYSKHYPPEGTVMPPKIRINSTKLLFQLLSREQGRERSPE
jgi:hypothetical protein